MSNMPWSGDAEATACNFAIGHLVGNLKLFLPREGHIYAETLLAAGGAIAGFSAQRALMTRLAATPDPDASRGLHIFTTGADHKVLLGDPLNDALIAKRDDENYEKVFSLATGAAVQNGLPDRGESCRHVASALGGEDEGWPSVKAEHRPALPVKDLLDVV